MYQLVVLLSSEMENIVLKDHNICIEVHILLSVHKVQLDGQIDGHWTEV